MYRELYFNIVFDFVLNNIGDNNDMRVYLIHYVNIYIFLNITVIVIVIMIIVIMITLIFILVITSVAHHNTLLLGAM